MILLPESAGTGRETRKDGLFGLFAGAAATLNGGIIAGTRLPRIHREGAGPAWPSRSRDRLSGRPRFGLTSSLAVPVQDPPHRIIRHLCEVDVELADGVEVFDLLDGDDLVGDGAELFLAQSRQGQNQGRSRQVLAVTLYQH